MIGKVKTMDGSSKVDKEILWMKKYYGIRQIQEIE